MARYRRYRRYRPRNMRGYKRYRTRRRYGRSYPSKRKIKKIVRSTAELKYHDAITDWTEAQVSYDGGVTDAEYLTKIAQGDGETQRVGRAAFLEFVQLRGQLKSAAGAVTVRVVVFLDKAPEGVAFTKANFFEQDVAAGDGVLAYKNILKATDARILWDHSWTMEATANGDARKIFFKTIKIKKNMTYRGTGATNSDLEKNHVGMFIFSDATNASNYSPAVRIWSRVRFRDY